MTAAYVYLDSRSQELRYSAAGHPPMLLLRRGRVLEIIENGLILAAFDFATFANAVQPLEPVIACCSTPTASLRLPTPREISLGKLVCPACRGKRLSLLHPPPRTESSLLSRNGPLRRTTI